jgi:hypothetical protein
VGNARLEERGYGVGIGLISAEAFNPIRNEFEE